MVPPFSVTSSCELIRSMTLNGPSGSNSEGAGAGKADDVAGELAHGHLHTRANAQIRNLVLTGKLGREDLALQGARLPKPPGTEMPEASPKTSETFCSSRLSPSTSWTSTWRS